MIFFSEKSIKHSRFVGLSFLFIFSSFFLNHCHLQLYINTKLKYKTISALVENYMVWQQLKYNLPCSFIRSINNITLGHSQSAQFWKALIWDCSCIVAELCPTLCNPMDNRLGYSIHRISQARILELVAISSARSCSSLSLSHSLTKSYLRDMEEHFVDFTFCLVSWPMFNPGE